jgi:fructan beta-fructosidase
MRNLKRIFPLLIGITLGFCTSLSAQSQNKEQYRPQFHFSPQTGWMNDPNGMVFLDGEYHLFYQHYPDKTVWGPMHWGHAISTDLVHWQHQPIALYPDSIGYIFSGSAVMDINNTSGFGEPGRPPMIAIFTYHNPTMERKGNVNFQSQGIAYSLDKGRTWIKFKNNPVLPNPGLRNFRDPKVSWNSDREKWIITLAVGDHVCFYSSKDLKEWVIESEFGKNSGAHGGVWECPDLFQIPIANEPGKTKWILLVSINPGAPNGGSGTQYFIGSFDGHVFTSDDSKIRWIDYGADNYAGVTWSNVKNRRIFIGWMSNWAYATKVPTSPWRSAMTIPRDISLVSINGEYYLKSMPVPELDNIIKPLLNEENVKIDQKGIELNPPDYNFSLTKTEMNVLLGSADELIIEISNKLNQKVIIGYNSTIGEIYIDRTKAGRSEFNETFAAKVHKLEVPKSIDNLHITFLIDKSSIELFCENGQYVMTDLVFPVQEYNLMKIFTKSGNATIERLKISTIESIWKQ